jgi:NNP family nitrate/nitrite transporter-like MFS transporter
MEDTYAVKTNELNKATELNLSCTKLGRDSKHGCHMRAFWASTSSFFLAFVGWFALAPVAVDVAHSISICENQLYPPMENPTRTAFLKFKTVDGGIPYCTHGKVGEDKKPTDCKPVPAGSTAAAGSVAAGQYNFKILPKCVCTPGTHCDDTLTYSAIGSVAVTIFVRVSLGTLLERYGPVNVQSCLMTFGAFWVAIASIIWSDWSFILIRTLIGCAGATFVTNQFWCSLMFAPNVVGTANATAAGWGNLGGGVTQIFIVWCLVKPFEAMGMDRNAAWRSAMVVPAFLFVGVAVIMKLKCQDTPTALRFTTADTGKATKASMWDYVDCLKDIRVVVMIFQYSACFGTELAMNARLATHFRTYFQMNSGDAAILAGCFGLMNLFARSLGGVFSDALFAKFNFPGRLWAQFIALFFEGLMLFAFANVDNSQPWYVALIVLIFFSLCVQMAEGTSYGIVPFMNPPQLACISAVVGAGGNLGAVIALWCFYKPLAPIDTLLPFKVHAGYVLFWACMNVCYYWPDKGGMFVAAKDVKEEAAKESAAM